MHTCEFCQAEFEARVQVKNPRACANRLCQLKRQRSNENDWRKRNVECFDSKYHSIRKTQRQRLIGEICAQLLRCIEVGRQFLGFQILMKHLEVELGRFLLELGKRRVNKFWVSDLAPDIKAL